MLFMYVKVYTENSFIFLFIENKTNCLEKYETPTIESVVNESDDSIVTLDGSHDPTVEDNENEDARTAMLRSKPKTLKGIMKPAEIPVGGSQEDTVNDQDSTQATRQRNVAEYCTERYQNTTIDARPMPRGTMYVDFVNEVVWCKIPKIASTSLIHFFLDKTGYTPGYILGKKIDVHQQLNRYSDGKLHNFDLKIFFSANFDGRYCRYFA